MTLFITKFKKYFIYGLLSLFTLPVFFGGYYEVKADLLEDMTYRARNSDQMIYIGNSVKTVGNSVVDNGEKSVIVRVTRLLLVLTIALSVTMILYNGMQYIIETGQGKEGKSLAKNVVLIVVGILIALFSSIIIALIQSVPNATINSETSGAGVDVKVLEQ